MRIFTGLEMRVRRLKRKLAPLIYAGSAAYCPICVRSFRKFRAAGRNEYRRPNAVCPQCAGRERDRLMALYIQRSLTRLDTPRTLLHIAPETCLVTSLMRLGVERYISGDLFRTDVDVRFDVERLPFPSESFDAVYCSHVLQAVHNDDAAVREIHRVMTPNAWAILNVPERGEKTFDFQQGGEEDAPPDFVRIYGRDFSKRLTDAGFDVNVITPSQVLSRDEQQRMFVHSATAGAIYFMRRSV